MNVVLPYDLKQWATHNNYKLMIIYGGFYYATR